MKVILFPPQIMCAECGSVTYVSRVKANHTDVVVTCLASSCKLKDVQHLFPLSIVDLQPVPAEPTEQEPYK